MCCRKNAFTVYHKLGIFLHCVPVMLCNELYCCCGWLCVSDHSWTNTVVTSPKPTCCTWLWYRTRTSNSYCCFWGTCALYRNEDTCTFQILYCYTPSTKWQFWGCDYQLQLFFIRCGRVWAYIMYMCMYKYIQYVGGIMACCFGMVLDHMLCSVTKRQFIYYALL